MVFEIIFWGDENSRIHLLNLSGSFYSPPQNLNLLNSSVHSFNPSSDCLPHSPSPQNIPPPLRCERGEEKI